MFFGEKNIESCVSKIGLCRFKSSFSFAFTLSEVLITLGIIGVVAALALPSVIRNYQESEYLNQFKESYAALSQAYIMAVQENGTVDTWDNTAHYNYFRPYLKISGDCGTSSLGCAPNASTIQKYDLNGNPSNILRYHFILANGSMVWFQPATNEIIIDLNGIKKPNTMGYDEQYLTLATKNGTAYIGPIYYPNPALLSWNGACKPNTNTGGWTNGMSCSAWILKHWNLDYLHRVIPDSEWGK